MTENTTVMGGVVEPRDAVAHFGFYIGPVSVRQRDGFMEVAFFAASVKPRLPMEGQIDGVRVLITGVTTRRLDPSGPPPPRGSPQSIVATVIPVTPA